jgi:glyoxalase family protein
MMSGILGIHHVTAIAIDPQANLDFYTQVLGLRLVKQTVNYDSPDTYHFYYSDEAGHPGSILTFFPFPLADKGRPGPGMTESVTFAVPQKAFEHWMLRLAEFGVETQGPFERFGAQVISFDDPDGLHLEIASTNSASDSKSLFGFDTVSLCVEAPERTQKLLTETFGYKQIAEQPDRIRLQSTDKSAPGAFVDLLCKPGAMHRRPGGGTVHHVAFRVKTGEEQKAIRAKIAGLGFNVTPILDRNYFHSIYFREPGGILFEIATDPPGFAVDEKPNELGNKLQLPPWLEKTRADIERRLPPIRLPGMK